MGRNLLSIVVGPVRGGDSREGARETPTGNLRLFYGCSYASGKFPQIRSRDTGMSHKATSDVTFITSGFLVDTLKLKTL